MNRFNSVPTAKTSKLIVYVTLGAGDITVLRFRCRHTHPPEFLPIRRNHPRPYAFGKGSRIDSHSRFLSRGFAGVRWLLFCFPFEIELPGEIDRVLDLIADPLAEGNFGVRNDF